MRHQRLRDDVAYRHTGIQRSVRILKDHLHLFAQRLQLLLLQTGNIFPVQQDLPICHIVHPNNRARTGRFSASALADQSECLPLLQGEAHAIYRMDDLLPGYFKMLGEVLDLQYIFSTHCLSLTLLFYPV